jgi:hypothetical protein
LLLVVAGAGVAACGLSSPTQYRPVASSMTPGPRVVATAVVPIGRRMLRYAHRAGWALVYPRSMHLEQSATQAMTSFSEVTIASFSQRTAIHTGSNHRGGGLNVFVHVDPPLDPSGRFSSDAVAFRILRVDGGPPPRPASDSRFLIALGTFHAGPYYRQPAGVPAPVQRAVVADGSGYTALVWIGRNAPPRMKSAIERVISSLAFPRVRPGTVTGTGYRVLELAARYPLGSFTRIGIQGQRYFHFYLVHAPGGFYAIGWGNPMADPGYASRCKVPLDQKRKQFYCSNLKARWDRLGFVITRPAGARSADPLKFAPVERAWDNHLLLDYSPSRRARG